VKKRLQARNNILAFIERTGNKDVRNFPFVEATAEVAARNAGRATQSKIEPDSALRLPNSGVFYMMAGEFRAVFLAGIE